MADEDQDIIVLSSDDESKPTKTKQVGKSSEQQKFPLKHTISKAIFKKIILKPVLPDKNTSNTHPNKMAAMLVNSNSKSPYPTDLKPSSSTIIQSRVEKNSSPHVHSFTNNIKQAPRKQSWENEKSGHAVSLKHLHVQMYKSASQLSGQTNVRTINSSKELNRNISNTVSAGNRYCNISSTANNKTPDLPPKNVRTYTESSDKNKASDFLNGNVVIKPIRTNNINMCLTNSVMENDAKMKVVPSSVITALQSKGVSVTSVVEPGFERKKTESFCAAERSQNYLHKVKDSLKRSNTNLVPSSVNNYVRTLCISNSKTTINSDSKSNNKILYNNKRKIEDESSACKRTKVFDKSSQNSILNSNEMLPHKAGTNLKINQKLVTNSLSSSIIKNNSLNVSCTLNNKQIKSAPGLSVEMSAKKIIDSQKNPPPFDTIKQLSSKKGITIQPVNQTQVYSKTKYLNKSRDQPLAKIIKDKNVDMVLPPLSLNSSLLVTPVNNEKVSLRTSKSNKLLPSNPANHPESVSQTSAKKSDSLMPKNIDIAKDRKSLMDLMASQSAVDKSKLVTKGISVGNKKLPISSIAGSKTAASIILNSSTDLYVSILPTNGCKSSVSVTSDKNNKSDVRIVPVDDKSAGNTPSLSVQNIRTAKHVSETATKLKDEHLSDKIKAYRLEDVKDEIKKWGKPCVELERLPLVLSYVEKIRNSSSTLSKLAEVDASDKETLPFNTDSKIISVEKILGTDSMNKMTLLDEGLKNNFDQKNINTVEIMPENSLNLNISELAVKKVLNSIISNVEESVLDISSGEKTVLLNVSINDFAEQSNCENSTSSITLCEKLEADEPNSISINDCEQQLLPKVIPLKYHDSFHSNENLSNKIFQNETSCTQISEELQSCSSQAAAVETKKQVDENKCLIQKKISCDEGTSERQLLLVSNKPKSCFTLNVSLGNISTTSLPKKKNLEKPHSKSVNDEGREENLVKLSSDNICCKKIESSVKCENSTICILNSSTFELCPYKQADLPEETRALPIEDHETLDRNLDALCQAESNSNSSYECSRNEQITSPKLSLKRRKTEHSPEDKSLAVAASSHLKSRKLELPTTSPTYPVLNQQTCVPLVEVPSSTEKIEENKKIFENLLEFSKSLMKRTIAAEKAKIINNMHRQFNSTESSFIKSPEFSELLNASLDRLKNKENVFVILNETRQKLKNHKCKNKTFCRLENYGDSNAVPLSLYSGDSNGERKKLNPIPSTSSDNISLFGIPYLKESVSDNSSDFLKQTENVCPQTLNTSESSTNVVNPNGLGNTEVGIPLSKTDKSCDANNKMTSLCIDVSRYPSSEKDLGKESPSLLGECNNSPIYGKNYFSTSIVSSVASASKLNIDIVGDLSADCSTSNVNAFTSNTLKKIEKEFDLDIMSVPSTSRQDSTNERLSVMLQESKTLPASDGYDHNKKSLHKEPYFSKVSKSVTKSKIDDTILMLKGEFKSQPTEVEFTETEYDPKTAAQIKILEKHCRKLEKKIMQLDNQELSFHEMESENSAYLEGDRYTKRYMKIYKLLCKLRNLPPRTGRAVEKKVVLEESRFKEINEAVQNLINRRKISNKFPDFPEVYEIIKGVSADIGLDERTINIEAQRMFTEVGLKLKKRRIKDHIELYDCYLQDGVNQRQDPAEHDQDLLRKITESGERFQKATQEILDKYVRMQEEAREADDPDKEGGSNEENEDDLSTDKEPSESKGKSSDRDETDSDCAVIEILNGSDNKSTDPNSDDDSAPNKCPTRLSKIHEQKHFLTVQEPAIISDDIVIESSNELPDIQKLLNGK